MRATRLFLRASVLAGSLIAGWCQEAIAESLLSAYAPLHATIESAMELQYNPTHGQNIAPDTWSEAHSASITADPFGGPYFDAYAAPAELFPYAGASGDPSDPIEVSINGTANLNLSFGAPVPASSYPNDTFNFRVQGTIDSTGAHASDTEPAIASAHATGEARFWFDAVAAGVPANYKIGTLVWNHVAIDPSHEDAYLELWDYHPNSAIDYFKTYLSPVDKWVRALYSGHEYRLKFSYSTNREPHEVQPYSMLFSSTVVLEPYDGTHDLPSVPEPAGILLALFGLALLPRRRRR